MPQRLFTSEAALRDIARTLLLGHLCRGSFVLFLLEGGVGTVSRWENAALALLKEATFRCGPEQLQVGQKASEKHPRRLRRFLLSCDSFC